MPRAVRVALIVVGLAAALYGVASLTGGWFGTPPWCERWQEDWGARDEALYPAIAPQVGREWVSPAVVAGGLALAAWSAWSKRLALVVLGLALAVYGASSLTGGWLGAPPWWTTTDVIGHSSWKVGRPGREWISAGAIAAGLGLAAFGARPRRRPVGAP